MLKRHRLQRQAYCLIGGDDPLISLVLHSWGVYRRVRPGAGPGALSPRLPDHACRTIQPEWCRWSIVSFLWRLVCSGGIFGVTGRDPRLSPWLKASLPACCLFLAGLRLSVDEPCAVAVSHGFEVGRVPSGRWANNLLFRCSAPAVGCHRRSLSREPHQLLPV